MDLTTHRLHVSCAHTGNFKPLTKIPTCIYLHFSMKIAHFCFSMMDALQGRKVNCSAGNWLTCFYGDGVYDPNDKLKGLFCGQPAFRVRSISVSYNANHICDSSINICSSDYLQQEQMLLSAAHLRSRRITLGDSPRLLQR